MPSPSMKNLQEISMILNRGRVSPEVSRGTVEDAIRSVAGSSNRTLEHYTILLCQADLIIRIMEDVFSLDVAEARCAMLQNVGTWLMGG